MTLRLLAPLLAALPALALAAAPPDPLGSAACASARAELESVLNEPAARRGERLEHARRRAAEACLGRAEPGRQRSGAPDPVQVVPPALAAPPPNAPAPAITAAPPPVHVPRPTAITACDPGGCWDSEGRRLNQVGPLLIGPGGACAAQGGVVQCP